MNNTTSNQPVVRVVAVEASGTNLNVPIQGAPAKIVDLGDRTIVVAGDGGVVTAGDRGSAIAGFQAEATAIGSDGLAYVLGGTATACQARGIAIAHTGGKATAALLAFVANGGQAIAYGASIAIAINRSISLVATAQACTGGLTSPNAHS